MKRLNILIALFFIYSCATEIDYSVEVITEDTNTKEALEIAIVRGGVFIKNALRIVVSREEQDVAQDLLLNRFLSKEERGSLAEQSNMIALLQNFNLQSEKAILLFETLKASLNVKQRELAWGIATAFPSQEMAIHIEKHLSQALRYNDLERELVPAMADSLSRNQISSSYTILKMGLPKIHDSSFVQAMIKLNPKKAPRDLLEYLQNVEYDELRQLNLENSNIEVCLDILDYLYSANPAPNVPGYNHLFTFAVSRNPVLSHAAIKILNKAAFEHRSHLALMLSREKARIQLAYIEKVRRSSNVQTRLFLKELKEYSSKAIVLKEIEEYLR